jgi:general stress protein CsbA
MVSFFRYFKQVMKSFPHWPFFPRITITTFFILWYDTQWETSASSYGTKCINKNLWVYYFQQSKDQFFWFFLFIKSPLRVVFNFILYQQHVRVHINVMYIFSFRTFAHWHYIVFIDFMSLVISSSQGGHNLTKGRCSAAPYQCWQNWLISFIWGCECPPKNGLCQRHYSKFNTRSKFQGK